MLGWFTNHANRVVPLARLTCQLHPGGAHGGLVEPGLHAQPGLDLLVEDGVGDVKVHDPHLKAKGR